MAALANSTLLSNASEFRPECGGISRASTAFQSKNSGATPALGVLAMGVPPESTILAVKTQSGTAGFDPERTLKIGPVNGREARESGLWLHHMRRIIGSKARTAMVCARQGLSAPRMIAGSILLWPRNGL
jgi:hypothetical protein